MVVWGGDGYDQTGARYDPLQDTWTSTSTVGAPTPRIGHRAVWTGSLMLVWGGDGDSNTGGRYAVSTDCDAASIGRTR
jgi:hypothetical protein